MDKKIYFCFPYKEVGGVSIVFLRLSKELSKKGYKCFLIDYKDGYMASHMDSDVELLEYHDHKLTQIPENSIVVFQSMTPWSIFPNLKIHPEAKVVFWNCHPFNLVPTMPGIRSFMQANVLFGSYILKTILRSYKKTIIKFISYLNKTNALFFMDYTNLKTTEEYLNILIDSPIFLPIPLKKISSKESHQPNKTNKKIRFAWIGRLVDFKFYILKRAITDIENLAFNDKNLKVELTIIGEGPKKKRLLQYLMKLNNVKFKIIDYIKPTEIEDFLLNEVDLLMAMGTSALEGARLGIPTILLDMAYNEVSGTYNYKWLNFRDGYTLGDVINKSHFSSDKDSLRQRLDEFLFDKKNISNQVRKYYDNNHSTDIICSKFVKLIDKSSCNWKDLESLNVTNRGYIYNMFTKIRGIISSS